MNAQTAMEAKLSKLRAPFAPNHISKLPKESKAQADERKADRTKSISNCPECGGWHHRNAVHLSYVGHAALTDRLLDTDLAWSWEPVAFNAEGLPAFDRNGGLWIKLTVGGVSRLGYGAADGKSGGDAVKEIIGDALRNAAMRFGAALDLWHKGELHPEDEPTPIVQETQVTAAPRQRPEPLNGPMRTRAEARTKYAEIVRELHSCEDDDTLTAYLATEQAVLAQYEAELPTAWEGDGSETFPGLKAEIEQAKVRCMAPQPWEPTPIDAG